MNPIQLITDEEITLSRERFILRNHTRTDTNNNYDTEVCLWKNVKTLVGPEIYEKQSFIYLMYEHVSGKNMPTIREIYSQLPLKRNLDGFFEREFHVFVEAPLDEYVISDRWRFTKMFIFTAIPLSNLEYLDQMDFAFGLYWKTHQTNPEDIHVLEKRVVLLKRIVMPRQPVRYTFRLNAMSEYGDRWALLDGNMPINLDGYSVKFSMIIQYEPSLVFTMITRHEFYGDGLVFPSSFDAFSHFPKHLIDFIRNSPPEQKFYMTARKPRWFDSESLITELWWK